MRSSGALLRGTVGDGLRKRACVLLLLLAPAPALALAPAGAAGPDLGISEGLAERASLGAASGLPPSAWLLMRRAGMRVAEAGRSAAAAAAAGDGLRSAPAERLSSASKDFLSSAEEGRRARWAEAGRLPGLAGDGLAAAGASAPPAAAAAAAAAAAGAAAARAGDGARGPAAPAPDLLMAAALKCASGSQSISPRCAAVGRLWPHGSGPWRARAGRWR